MRSALLVVEHPASCSILYIYVTLEHHLHRASIRSTETFLAFAHIHGKAGTPTEAIWNAVVGRNGPLLCAEEGVDFRAK
jgi:hypothetical protein